MKKPLIVAATGASGFPLLEDCLRCLRADGRYHVCLILSENARRTIPYELDQAVEDLEALADEVLSSSDIAAGPASGTYRTAGMLIVPCSMKTAAGIITGYTDNLILRAADVTIKEQRPLVLAVRETPLSRIHLRNLYELSGIPGVHVIPPMMSFYNKPSSIDSLVRHISGKLLEPFGVEVEDFKRWKE